MTAVELLAPADATPANPRWHELRAAGVSASEIAMVLGISPWGSAFSLYWQKLNGWGTEANAEMTSGRYAEGAIAEWVEREYFLEERTRLVRAGLYANPDRLWQLATPDRLVVSPNVCVSAESCRCDDEEHYDELVECKLVLGGWDGWGEPDTDEVPVYYRAQALWQIDVLGAHVVHIAAWHPPEFRVYRVERDDADIEVMRKAGAEFVARLVNGDPPSLDDHTETIATLKKLHPDLEDREQEVAPDIAQAWREARERKAAAEADERRYEAELRAAMGPARRGTVAGEKVATRVISEIAERTQTVAAHRRDYLLAPRSKK